MNYTKERTTYVICLHIQLNKPNILTTVKNITGIDIVFTFITKYPTTYLSKYYQSEITSGSDRNTVLCPIEDYYRSQNK